MLISIVGITIGVISLTVSLALFSGYQKLLKEIILGVNAHIYILKYSNKTINDNEFSKIKSILDTTDAVFSYAPFIYTEGMAINHKKSGNKMAGVILRGIDYESEGQTTRFNEFISKGRFIQKGKYGVIGEKVAKRLNVEIGDTISIITPMNADITFAGIIPKREYIKISGIFSSGMFDFDNSLLFLNIKESQQFLNMNEQYSGIAVKLISDEIQNTSMHSELLLKELGYPFNVTNWIELNSNLFTLLKLEKWVIFIILGLIIVVAGFGMTSVLAMHIFDKKKQIGILKAMGAQNKDIKQIFLHRNIIIGFSGIILGLLLGIILSQILTYTDLVKIESDVYLVDKLIVKNNPIDFVYIVIVSGLIILGSAYFPLKKIAKMDAVSIIRGTKK
ncbi:MAG: FtsX-like permease family protein [Candidatus Cloacimonadota bacterium]|nr:FtsX-like permease family protein [Candidatus Cloacimonadota bacterium]